MFEIEEELKKLPDSPGVYIMHGKSDEILYVGKAVNLKNRVRQYFRNKGKHSPKIERLVENIAYFEYIITDTELEALVLECNLIKEHRPKYNTMLKDDKSYPYIRVTVEEEYPRVMFQRRMKNPQSKYFGPYPAYISETLELLHQLYRLKTCNRNLPRDIGKERPCINYQIGRCDAPCQGYVDSKEYRKKIEEIINFLEGNYETITDSVTEKMQECSEKLEFEEAAKYRDMLLHIKRFSERQKINSNTESEDRDIIAVARADAEAVVQVFFIRGGRLIGKERFSIEDVKEERTEEIYSDFIKDYYSGTPYIPKELMLAKEPDDSELLANWLGIKKGTKVSIRVPKRGEKARLVDLAFKNATMLLNQDRERAKLQNAKTVGALRELRDILRLSSDIRRIECFDISNTSGFLNVGAMVVFLDGKPKKNDYRKFKIKGVEGADDYASMEEMLRRRFLHGLEDKEKLQKTGEFQDFVGFSSFPDLILMDGGRGQVNICLKVLSDLGIDIPVAGLVKDDKHRTRGLYYENHLQPIDSRGELFFLLTRIQDETHRFAIDYHKSLRGKAQIHSILDDIKGIGAVRKKALMKYFGSVERLKEASLEELSKPEGMNEAAALSVYQFFRKN